MKKLSTKDYIKNFVFENKVALIFVIICAFAYHFSGMTTVMFFNEIAIRVGRETFIVLALLVPVVAGLGLNFGIVLGAMSAQIAIFLVILMGGSGIPGIITIALIATPIAILFGFLVGILFNKMKGSEMIGGMVTSLFADGFYQLLFLWVMGGLIPITYARVMTGTGVGVLNTINLDTSPTYMRQVIDNVMMMHILEVAFYAMIAFMVCLIIFRLAKKKPIRFTGENNIKKPVIALAALFVLYAASGFGGALFVNPITHFLFSDRLNALFTVQWGSLLLVLYAFFLIIRTVIKEKEKMPVGLFVSILVITVVFALSFLPAVRYGLEGTAAYTFIPMLGMMTVAFYSALIWVALSIVKRKKMGIPVSLKGEDGILIPVLFLALFGFIYIGSGFGGLMFQQGLFVFIGLPAVLENLFNSIVAGMFGLTVSLSNAGIYLVTLIRIALILSVVFLNVFARRKGRHVIPYRPLVILVIVGVVFERSFATEIYIGLQYLGLPVLTYLLIALLCVFIRWFMNTRLGQNMRTVGQSRPVANAAGINVDRTRVIAMIISTVLASYGQIIVVQNFGVLNTYGQHRFVALYAIAALLVGGATVAKASIKHALLGVLLFHSLFILAPFAGANLTGSGMIGEYFRVFVSYAVISVALIMHAWKRAKAKKEKEPEKEKPADPPPIIVEPSQIVVEPGE